MNTYSKRNLVLLTGITPQVVTETLYALVREGRVPTVIHLVTTSLGAKVAEKALLDAVDGQFHAFCRDEKIDGSIHFDASSIHVIRDDQGKPLDDIRTPSDNQCAANAITGLIQRLCEDDDAQVWVSIAGGRKTMSFFAGYALSLFGRGQDALMHVLVSAPFESQPSFFYPTQSLKEWVGTNGQRCVAKKAQVTLADIPFVRLRAGTSDTLVKGEVTYSEAVTHAQTLIDSPLRLVFHGRNCCVTAGSATIQMQPSIYATFLWMAKRRVEGLLPCRPGFDVEVEEFLSVYRWLLGRDSAGYVNAEVALKHREDFLPFFQEKRSLVHRLLRKALGDHGAQPYLIEASSKRLDRRYGLTLEEHQIQLPKLLL